MAERIQLKEPGSALVMFVAGVKPETVERNDYYLFINTALMGGAKEMLVPQSSIKGRFERLGITDVQQMVGKFVRFARSTKMSRAGVPYWDIDWASEAENGSAGGGGNAGNPASAPPVDSAKPKMRDAYKDLTKWVISDIANLYGNRVGFDANTIAAITATLFIQACKSGKVE